MRLGSVENPFTMAAYAVFGLVFLAIGIAMLVWWNPAALVFLPLGLLFSGAALHTVLGAGRYGEVQLEILRPAYPGGRLEARLLLPGGAGGATELLVELNCKEVLRVRHGGEHSFRLHERLLWHAQTRAPLTSLVFDIPTDAPLSQGASNEYLTTPGVYWEVQVESENVPGVDLMRGFRFPVTARPSGAPPAPLGHPLMSQFQPPPSPDDGPPPEIPGARDAGRVVGRMVGRLMAALGRRQ